MLRYYGNTILMLINSHHRLLNSRPYATPTNAKQTSRFFYSFASKSSNSVRSVMETGPVLTGRRALKVVTSVIGTGS